MRSANWFRNYRPAFLSVLAALLIFGASAWAAPQARLSALPFESGQIPLIMETMPADFGRNLDDPGDVVDFDAALVAAGDYLKQFQADITEDNAGNGSGESENPNDPDDGGWDWRLNWDTDAHFHSTAASPTNIYGATALGLYYAYLATGDAGHWTALLDAADHMVAVGDNIRSGADVKFLMLFDDLYDVEVSPTSTYADAAKSKYDNRITAYGSATALAQYIRDARHGQGYDNGIIAWDIGIWVVDAQMLYARYGGTYDADADAMAEVLWQDSFNDTPGYFDIVDDAGWDETYSDPNFYWYTLGITGLVDAFSYSGSHAGEIPDLITRLLDSQYTTGAFSYCYGANTDDEDWQSTAYSAMTLNDYDATTYASEIQHAAYWTAATQHSGGGWVYSSGNHYPEVGGENTCAVSFGGNPSEVWVNDDWTSQADVDAYNSANGTDYVWGYDAFGNIQDGINGVGSSTIHVLPGTYPTGIVQISSNLTIIGTDPVDRPVITATTSTGMSGDARGWFLIDDGIDGNFQNLEFDGSGFDIHQGLRHKGSGTVVNCAFSNLVYPSEYAGLAIVAFGNYDFTVEDCEFSNIGRVGALFFGPSPNPRVFRGNIYTGKGVVDGLDYACELGGGAVGTVENNVISNCTGVASSDGSTSAGFLATDYYAPGTQGTYHGNIVTGNTEGFAIGYDASDATVATITGNKIEGNTARGVGSVSTVLVEATANWWGDANGPDEVVFLSAPARVQPMSPDGDPPVSRSLDGDAVSGDVHYSPWVASSGDDDEPGTAGWQPDLSTVGVSTNGTIQEGINLVTASTVNVVAGNYGEMVSINKSVTLRGANAGIHPAVGTHPTEVVGVRVAETILTNNGHALVPSADNITVDGFKFTGNGGRIIDTYANANSFHLTNCIFDNNVRAVTQGVIQFGDGSHTNCLFDFNLFDDQGDHTFYAGVDAFDGLTFQYNKFNVVGDAIFWAALPLVDGVIEGNEFDGTIGAVPGAGFCGLNIGQGGNIVISDNWFHDMYYTAFQVGIIGGSVTDNVFEDMYPIESGGTWYASNAFQLWGGEWGTAVSTNVDVSGNTIHYNAQSNTSVTEDGIRFRAGVDAANIHIEDNFFYNHGAQPSPLVLKNLEGTPADVDHNCYSDFGANVGFPTQYNIPNTLTPTDIDYNPSSDCSNIDMVMSSDYVGCPAGCEEDTLYLRFDQVDYFSGQVIIELPDEMVADWTGVADVTPASEICTANLWWAQAEETGSTIEVNCLWGPDPNRSVDDGKYFAAIPLRATTDAYHGEVLEPTITSYNFADAAGEHTTGFTITPAASIVDCDAPIATLSGGGGAGGCNAYGNASSFQDALTTAMTATGTGGAPASPLDHAYIEHVGSSTQWTVPVTGGTFPTGSESPDVWGTMTEGCNTFVLHALDTECNEGESAELVVVKDETAPSLTVTNTSSFCYNDISGSPQYGGTELDDYLGITTGLNPGSQPSGCYASTGELVITYSGNDYGPITLEVTGYPDATEVVPLWTWIVSQVPGADGEDYTFDVTATDCAGNEANNSFTICIDLTAPSNTFTEFDARPTHLGVWLNWTWSAGTGATAMQVWRKPEWVTGDPASDAYPVYSSNKSLSDANYEKVYANLIANGWTMAATQTGAYTSAVYPGTHGGPGGAYWKDVIGTDDTPLRDIYRYVTFVRDAVGNWSFVSTTYTLLTNADRSTNYWLGDYAPLHGGSGSPGVVDGPDIGLLSVHYFTTVQPAWDYLDIGPENHENAYGKGIPNPDQEINFADLLPFSFNFGVVQPGGFNVRLPETKPFSGLDAEPVVSASCGEDLRVSIGDEFTVTVALSGNAEHAVKVAEAQLHFDPEVLELVSATEGEIEVLDGVPFVLTRPIEGCENAIGIAAAALGEIAGIAGDFSLASIEFRWIGEQTSTTEIELTAIQLADGHGNIIEGTGTILTVNGSAAIPDDYALYQNYPNPFNPTTRINFDLPEASEVRLAVFNLLGQEVRTLVAGQLPAGRHFVAWDGRDANGQVVGSGLYLYRLHAGNFVSSRKMLLTR